MCSPRPMEAARLPCVRAAVATVAAAAAVAAVAVAVAAAARPKLLLNAWATAPCCACRSVAERWRAKHASCTGACLHTARSAVLSRRAAARLRRSGWLSPSLSSSSLPSWVASLACVCCAQWLCLGTGLAAACPVLSRHRGLRVAGSVAVVMAMARARVCVYLPACLRASVVD